MLEPITTFDPENNSDSDESLENFGAEPYIEPTTEEKEENKILPCSNCELLKAYEIENNFLKQQVDLLVSFIKNTRPNSIQESSYEFLDKLCKKPEDEHFSSYSLD